MAAIPPLEEPLSDGLIALRQTASRDIPEILIAYQEDPRLHERMSRARPPSGAELGHELEQAESERVQGTRVSLTIVEPPADKCCGTVSVHTIDWENRRAELGVWVAPRRRGKGLGRRALALAAGWLFATCGLVRLELLTEPDNHPMLRAAEAAGFLREGVLRAHRRGKVKRRDMVVLSLLESDLRPAPTQRGEKRFQEQAR